MISIQKVLKQAEKLAIPSKKELNAVEKVTKSVLNKINKQLKKDKIKAELMIGGSVAKGTFMPGATDIDCFLRFDYKTYSKKSNKISEIAEKIIKKCFSNVKRLHGSRDYFQIKAGKFVLEIVPVLKIKNIKEAKNITDISPMHVDWVHSKIKKNKNLASEIRLAKQFFKGSQIYGAESYIRGFSGHVIEVLTSHYGSLKELLENAQHWEDGHVIDTMTYYKNKSDAINNINRSKISPLIVIDPIQPDRNAAAALSKEKFLTSTFAAREFLKNPSIKFFKPAYVTIDELKGLEKKRWLVVLEAEPQSDKQDIAGAKLLKQFKYIQKHCKLNEFKILEDGWQWKGKGSALFWFYFDPKTLSPTFRHLGPPKIEKNRFIGFMKKYRKAVKEDNGRLYVELKREFRHPLEFINKLIKIQKFRNLKIVKIK